MNLKVISQYASCVAISIALAACGSSSTDSENISADNTANTVTAEKESKAQNVFNTIPGPVEATKILKDAGAKYNPKYLNPIENVSKYSTVTARALNLGVYSADLSFTSVFDKTQESMLYLKCTNNLATGLGISGAFDENTSSRIDANMENRDSLLKIISDSYWISDSYLRNNGQAGVSALLVAGGWMEGLYIATQIANDTKNEMLISHIGDQKVSLDNLVALLEIYKDNAGVNDMYNSLLGLKKIYDALPAEAATADTTKSTEKTTVKLSPEQLKLITDKVSEIRKKMIQ